MDTTKIGAYVIVCLLAAIGMPLIVGRSLTPGEWVGVFLLWIALHIDRRTGRDQ